jgi:hypothetical protein
MAGGVTKRCLSWLTNRALVYEPRIYGGGGGGVAGSNPMSAPEHRRGPQKIFGNIKPNLTNAKLK